MSRRYPALAAYLEKAWGDLYPTLASVLVLGRNIVNQENVDILIDAIIAVEDVKDPKIQKWLKSNFKNYLIRDHNELFNVRSLPADAPDWMKKAFERGDKLQEVRVSPAFRDKIAHAIDFMRSDEGPERLDRLTVPEAIRQSDEWTQMLMKKKSGENAADGERVFKKYPDGYSWRFLESEAAVNREGTLMGHCVSSYWKYIGEGSTQIASLRDGKNEPHCTLEIDRQEKFIRQIKGKSNAPVVEKYQSYVQDILSTEFKKFDVEQDELRNTGLFKIGDRVVNARELAKDPEALQAVAKDRFDQLARVDAIAKVKSIKTVGGGLVEIDFGNLQDAVSAIGMCAAEGSPDLRDTYQALWNFMEDYTYDPSEAGEKIFFILQRLQKEHPALYRFVMAGVTAPTPPPSTPIDFADWFRINERSLGRVLDVSSELAVQVGWSTGTLENVERAAVDNLSKPTPDGTYFVGEGKVRMTARSLLKGVEAWRIPRLDYKNEFSEEAAYDQFVLMSRGEAKDAGVSV